jgi:hypothetical protein
MALHPRYFILSITNMDLLTQVAPTVLQTRLQDWTTMTFHPRYYNHGIEAAQDCIHGIKLTYRKEHEYTYKIAPTVLHSHYVMCPGALYT